MQNNLQSLMITCQQMVQNGSSPTVALLRAKAPFKVSVTEAIEAIKQFNAANGASPAKTERHANSDTIGSLANRVTQLESKMAQMQAQLDAYMNHK